MLAKFTAAATSSSPASGQIDCLWVTMTLSMMLRWTSGIAAVAAVPTSAPPTVMMTSRR